MMQAVSIRLILSVTLIWAVGGSATVRPPMNRVVTRHVSAVVARPAQDTISPGQARVLESMVSRLPATTVVDTDAATPAAPAPEPTAPPADQPAPPPAPEPRLEYVPTSAALERQVANALVSQTGIKRAIGSSGAILPFPGILRQVEQSGEEVQLKAFGLAGKRLTFDAEHQMFSGTIWVGVNEIVGGRPPRPLVTPVDFEVLDAEFAEPSQVRVVRTGAPYAQVQLRLAAAVDGGAVTIISNLAPEPISLGLPVNPALIVEAGNAAIEGLGLGTSDVNVSVIGLNKPQGRVVTLYTNAGFLSSTRLRLDENGVAHTTLRSDGLGGAQVTASSPGFARTSIPVDFRLPHITFLASVLGGLVGGAIRLGMRARRGSSLVRPLVVAVLLGILVFALYAVGVNVLPVSPTVTVGAALVFAVSGLGAFLGPSILKGR